MELSALQKKIKQCKEVVIRNIPPSLTREDIEKYIKKNKMSSLITDFLLQKNHEQVVITFKNHSDALNFYKMKNFEDCFQEKGNKMFNIHLKIDLKQQQEVKYLLDGVTKKIIKKIFETAKEVGLCKILPLTTVDEKGKTVSQLQKGVLSFVRCEELSETQFEHLQKNLEKMKVSIKKINKLGAKEVQEKKEKPEEKKEEEKNNYYIQLFNLFAPTSYKSDLHEVSKKETKMLLEKVNPQLLQKVLSLDIIHCQHKKLIIQYTALIQCSNQSETKALFQALRLELLIRNDLSKVRLQLKKNPEMNFQVIFQTNLINFNNLSQKKYENLVLNTIRAINKNTLQVSCQESHKNRSIYNAKILFDSQKSGKQFLVDYPNYISSLKTLYHLGTKPNFNIWINSQNLNCSNFQEEPKVEKTNKTAFEMIKFEREIQGEINHFLDNQEPYLNFHNHFRNETAHQYPFFLARPTVYNSNYFVMPYQPFKQ